MFILRHSALLLASGLLAVSASTSATAATLQVPHDHKTIQAAIDAAKPGDTVIVEPGTDNVTRAFEGPSIVVKKPTSPVHVYNNAAISTNPKDSAVDIDGDAELVDTNLLKTPGEIDESTFPDPPIWPLLSRGADGGTFHPLANTDRQMNVEEGPWKLVVTYGNATTYALFNTAKDPQGKVDLSERLEQITFRLRGRLERREGLEYQAEMRGKGPGR